MIRWIVPLSVALCASCVELDAPPCTAAGKCLDGYECIEKQCLACVAGGCGGYQALAVGRGGGRVCSDARLATGMSSSKTSSTR